MAFPQNILDQIQDRCDIVEVIASYIPLKRAGRNYRAACPFHQEKTPSFMVSPQKQIYHCFGCGAGGNVFNFIMQHERLEFPEVVRMLAQKTGVPLPESRKIPEKEVSLTNQLYKINELAAVFYQTHLNKPAARKAAYEYLISRGINDGTIESFRLGYAPKLWQAFLDHARTKGINASLLEKAGLVIPGQKEGYYDRFRNRIMFPIFDIKGKVMAFGGRVLDDAMPKYMNSPDTYIYNKGRHLYGLNLSRDYIRDNDKAIITEGYLDLIVPYQAGVRNIVATLGTALSIDQIRLLKRYTHNTVMIYDADAAGQMATLRNLDLLLQEGLHVEIAPLPSGHDPDSFTRKYGKEKFEELINNAKDLFDYKLGLMVSRHDPHLIKGKARIAEEMLPTLARIPNAVVKSGYLRRLAEALSIPEEALHAELKKVKSDYSYHQDKPVVRQQHKMRTAERMLIGLMLESANAVKRVKKELKLSDFREPVIRQITEELFSIQEQGRSIEANRLISQIGDAGVSGFISEVLMETQKMDDKGKILEDCIEWIKAHNFKDQLRILQSEIKLAQDSGDDGEVTRLVGEYNGLIRSTR